MIIRFKEILGEIDKTLETLDATDCESLVDLILESRTIILFGAGRVGLAMKSFAKRLRHLGFQSYFLEDSTVPVTGKGDLMIIGSGSGSTPSVKIVAELAKLNGLSVALITTNSSSPIAQISSAVVRMSAPSKDEALSLVSSNQPMTTLFEQSLNILLDALVLNIMDILGETNESMKRRHNVIE